MENLWIDGLEDFGFISHRGHREQKTEDRRQMPERGHRTGTGRKEVTGKLSETGGKEAKKVLEKKMGDDHL